MFLFLCFILLLEANLIKSHKCGIHLEEKPTKTLTRIQQASDDWKPIRIHFDFSYIESIDGFSLDKLNLLREQVMPRVAKTFERLIKVRPVIGNLILIDNPCGKFKNIPDRYLNEGVSADIIIFVTVEDAAVATSNVSASAFHCLQDEITLRPLSGYVKFNPNFETGNKYSSDYMVDLTIHEMTHVLVMNPSLYDDWRKVYSNGRFNDSTYRHTSGVIEIRTPMVLTMLRSHLNISNEPILGLRLEDQGGDGTLNSHWEKKFMNTDIMTGDSSGETFISSITLAMFTDSGWYQADLSLADPFMWGKGQGSKFLQGACDIKQCVKYNTYKNCIEWSPPTYFKNSFCQTLDQTKCSNSYINRSKCLKTGLSLCPSPVEITNGQSYHGGSCRDGSTKNTKSFEKICPECACFESNLEEVLSSTSLPESFIEKKLGKLKKYQKQVISDFSAMCFEFKCKDGDIYVKVKDGEYKCSDENSIIIPGFNGKINCPPKNILCDQKYFWKYGLDLKNKLADSDLKIPFNPPTTYSKTPISKFLSADIENTYEPIGLITSTSFSLPMAKYFKMFSKLPLCKTHEQNHPKSICYLTKDIWIARGVFNTDFFSTLFYRSDKYKKIIVSFKSDTPYILKQDLNSYNILNNNNKPFYISPETSTNYSEAEDYLKQYREKYNIIAYSSPLINVHINILNSIITQYSDYQIILVAHSQAAAMSSIFAKEFNTIYPKKLKGAVSITYGQPKLGSQTYISNIESIIPTNFRIVRKEDAIPTYPRAVGTEIDYEVPYALPKIGDFYLISKEGTEFKLCNKIKVSTDVGKKECSVKTKYYRHNHIFYFNDNLIDINPVSEYNKVVLNVGSLYRANK